MIQGALDKRDSAYPAPQDNRPRDTLILRSEIRAATRYFYLQKSTQRYFLRHSGMRSLSWKKTRRRLMRSIILRFDVLYESFSTHNSVVLFLRSFLSLSVSVFFCVPTSARLHMRVGCDGFYCTAYLTKFLKIFTIFCAINC